MAKIVVLGAGNMGSYIAANLANDNDVTITDKSQDALDRSTSGIDKICSDLSIPANVAQIVSNYDFVVSALPEAFGFEALEAAIGYEKDAVDISFWNQSKERLIRLNNSAHRNNVTAFVDCGIAPGFSNATVAYFDRSLDNRTKNANIYVGGIPANRSRGFFAPWSIAGLIEEYQRPALFVRDRKPQTASALSTTKKVTLPYDVGELEAGLTDGLRSIAYNLDHIDNMAEYTLRYPGHFGQMKLLRSLGYFEDTNGYLKAQLQQLNYLKDFYKK